MADVIRTERLTLRPLRADDAAQLFALFANWQVIRWLSMPPWPYTLADAQSFIGSRLNQDLTNTSFAIAVGDALVGAIDVRMSAPAQLQRGPGPNLGYWLGQPYWGRGYMTEAARGFVPHVFAARLGDTIYSGAFADNEASLRVQEKLGFERDGETTLHSKPRGADFPHVNTKLTRSAFEARGK
jgi:RimJ/RimL family protein N-acetyltransferase